MARRLNRLLAGALGALIVAGSLAGCSTSSDSANGGAADGKNPEWKDLTFTVGEQSDGIVSLIKESGAFKDASYKINFAKFEYGPPLVAAAANGDIDLGMVGAVPPITAAAKNLDFKIIAQQAPYDATKGLEGIIVPKDSTLQTAADLKGKRIAVPQGSSAHGLVLSTLKSVGLTPKDVELVYLPPKEGASAFDSGKVDAWSIWDPLQEFAVQKGARVLVPGVPPLDYGNLFYVGSGKTLKDPVRRAALADVLTRISKAYAFGNANKDAHIKAIAKDSGITEEQAAKTIEGWRYRLKWVSPETIAGEQTLADNFFEVGEIPQKVDVTSTVDNILPNGYDVG
ncbi:aliphatic sulfonate ABC transporter substrate-binding protein [Smaragdicoccus niigatensis]|uniref:aliphatic sulfonate ABC transporter substrate-binding protein n=1 Tax=Smaragdicoccus niigatensis TaxID=359359 RepID=UPI00035E50C3|nr:aliphatic sulfonate ABC transporter substrate-binding protein [Smaragdicoccus niigatensis]